MSLNVVSIRDKVPQAPIPHQEISARLNEQRSTNRFCNPERYGHGFVTRPTRFDLCRMLFAHLLLLQKYLSVRLCSSPHRTGLTPYPLLFPRWQNQSYFGTPAILLADFLFLARHMPP